MTGTSMASPYVAGRHGPMLARQPDLTAAQCLGILQRTARPLPGPATNGATTPASASSTPDAAVEEAVAINVRAEVRLEG